jgi:hypothetical protein
MLVAGLAALLGIYAPYLLKQLKPETILLPILPFTVLYVFVISSVGHFFVSKSLDGNPKGFINVFMAVMGLKLLFYFAYLIIYVFTHKSNAVPFLIWFMVYYVVFTAFDISFLLFQNSKRN